MAAGRILGKLAKYVFSVGVAFKRVGASRDDTAKMMFSLLGNLIDRGDEGEQIFPRVV